MRKDQFVTRDAFDTVLRTFCWSMLVAIFASMLVSCASVEPFDAQSSVSSPQDTNESSGISFDEGGTVPIIQMPFAAGHVSQCTQGAYGQSSHHSTSTMYDIDFDTSNTSKEELRAPVSGVAYVHTEDASKNFGYHVNIDLGNGTYVILGHMADIAAKNGEPVVAGQFVGHEGCTGYCSGDHVHVGLHMGDARKMGEFGASIPVRYMLADKNLKSRAEAIDCTSLVCGIKSLGDPVNGHMYISALPSVNAQTVSSAPSASSSSAPSQPPQQTDPPLINPKTSTDDVWVNDLNLDGMQETLMLSAARWADPILSAHDAFVWGTGGCFDGLLLQADRVSPQNGYYQIDFSKLGKPCLGDLTLISALGSDGSLPNLLMSNWNWWQNASVCSKGSPFCQLQKNGHSWEEWMIRVSWDPYEGLIAFGNGYTKNSQLP
ncbi:MAG: M23 family metallopeptidase [Candidatus Uhrbacteria bacterium]|nr:M23 family metallopeptidase [Candidatus Uhrbacteria bacterium]